MNLNNFIDYTRSKPITVHGFQAHVQAHAIHNDYTAGGERTLLLVLQGRATHVRALWAAFHEKTLITRNTHYTRDDGKVYISPNPTIALPQGIQMWIIHHDLTPTHCSHTQDYFLTFGPPHFGSMLAATTAVPILPHWEQTIFQFGRYNRLIRPLRDCYNTKIWIVSRNTEKWLKTLSYCRKELPDEPR